MANEITLDNINTLAQVVTSVNDGDYIYILKYGAEGFSRIEVNLFNQILGNGQGGSSGIDSTTYEAIKSNVNTIQQKVDALISALAGIAFNSLPKPNLIGELTWPSADSAIPVLTSPSVSSIDVGTSNADTRTTTFLLKGSNLTKPISLSVVGTGFSVSPASVSAANANSGVTITITHTDTSITGGSASGTLTIASDDGVSKNISLTARKGASVETRVNVTVILTGCTLNGVSDGKAGMAPMNGSFSGMLVAASGYQLPITNIAVTMGGQPVSFDSGSGNTFNASTGELVIGTVTGAIEITATATVESQEYVIPTIKVLKNASVNVSGGNVTVSTFSLDSTTYPNAKYNGESMSKGGKTICVTSLIDLPVSSETDLFWYPNFVYNGATGNGVIAFYNGSTFIGHKTASATSRTFAISGISGLADAIANGNAKARITFLMDESTSKVDSNCGLWYGTGNDGTPIWVPETNGDENYTLANNTTDLDT